VRQLVIRITMIINKEQTGSSFISRWNLPWPIVDQPYEYGLL